jgi:pimeloyl-ACP methyl ester carboxylesterase
MPTDVTRRVQSGYADVNGLHMYYELHGSGSPLVLLHGGMLTIELNFASLVPTLAVAHQVVGVELQGHGRTADIDRAITPAALAGDVVALLDHLGIPSAHIFGHSMGGAVAMELAISHPDRVRHVVAASVTVRPEGLHEDLTDPQGKPPPLECRPVRTSGTFGTRTSDSHRTRNTSTSSSPLYQHRPLTREGGPTNSSQRSARRSCW